MQIMWIVKKDTGIDFRFLLLCLVGIVAATNLESTAEKKAYFCLGTDVCNKVGKWQWCDEDVEMRCRDCSEKEKFCGTLGMPQNCSTFCLERGLEREKGKDCQPLETIRYGNHNGTKTGTKHKASVELQCQPGYHCQGQCTTTCGDFGQYTHSLSCTENQCPALPFPKDGKYSPEKLTYEVNDMINFTCKDSFRLVGSQSAKCTSNGTWSITEYPACEEGKKIINGERAVAIAIGIGLFVIGMVVGWCACQKCHSKKEKDRINRKGTNSDAQEKGEETEPLKTEPTGKEAKIEVEDETVKYSKLPHGHSEPDFSQERVNSSKRFERQDSVSENNIPSRVGPGTDSGISTTNPSKDSGLHVVVEPSEGESTPLQLNFTFMNCNNTNTNTNQQNNTMPDNSGQSKDEERKPAENIPKTAAVDKYPTEETTDSKNECRGELQDNEEAGEEEGLTEVKERTSVKEKNGDHVPEARSRFPVHDQEEFQPDTNSGIKAGKMAIGSNTMDHADIKTQYCL